jgi:hypothetical protein
MSIRSILFRVVEREYITYKFNNERGEYREEDIELEIFCPECDEDPQLGHFGGSYTIFFFIFFPQKIKKKEISIQFLEPRDILF